MENQQFEKREIPLWLIVTRIPRSFLPDVVGNYLVRAMTKDEAVAGVKHKFFSHLNTGILKLEYVCSNKENPMLVRGVQMDKCVEFSSLAPDGIFGFCDLDFEQPECEFCGATDQANCPHHGDSTTGEIVVQAKTEMCEICEEMWEESFICEPCSKANRREICLNCCRHAVAPGGAESA